MQSYAGEDHPREKSNDWKAILTGQDPKKQKDTHLDKLLEITDVITMEWVCQVTWKHWSCFKSQQEMIGLITLG